MSRFVLTNPSNDCPVCGDVFGKCRSNADDSNYFQCVTHSGAAKFDIISGFKHIGLTKDGRWGQFVLEAGQTQKTYEERQQSRLDREVAERAIFQAGLSPAERHTAHTQLLAQLSLHDDDRADLERRGLSAEKIETFRSIEPGQTLDHAINPKTPGVGFGGKKLLTRTAGYPVPAFDSDGNITGFQIRNRAGDKPKYPWLSVAGIAPANLQNGEMPITFARGDNGSTLYFAEGILKPMVAAEKLGINVIGASGGNFASSPEQLQQFISALSPKTLVLCPDAGSIENAHVMRSYAELNAELASQGRQLKVLWWEQRTKASRDIDEIGREQFEAAELISWAEFDAKNISQPIAQLSDEKPVIKVKSNRPLEIVKDPAEKAAAARLKLTQSLRASKPGYYGLTAPERTVINEKYITIPFPAEGSVLGISGLMETGKTVAIGGVKSEFFSRYPHGMFDLQGYRIGLGKQTAFKWGIDHISDLEATGAAGITQMLINDADALAYCLDSLNRRVEAINQAIADGRKVCIVLDEADAVLKHILGGGTLGRRQAEIWQMWCESLSAVIAANGFIIIAEANLSQISVDAITEITGAPVSYIENIYQPHAGRKVIDYSVLNKEGKPSDPLMAKACFSQLLRLVKDGPVFLATDVQGFAERTEAALVAASYKVLRIDGDTKDKPETRAFLENPDAYIAEHQPDVVIATTTAESGVSISGGYFQNVIVYGSHLEDRALAQLSGRVRGAVLLHLFVKHRVHNSGDNADGFSVESIMKDWQASAFDSGAAADIHAHFDAELLRAAAEATQGEHGERLHRLKATYQARLNISRFSLHYGVISILERMGCDIECRQFRHDEYSDDELRAWINAIDLVEDRRTGVYVEAPLDKSVSWAIRVQASASSTHLHRVEADKVLLNADLPGLPLNDAEFVKAEIIKGRGDRLRAHTFSWLCQNPKIAKIIDLHSWKSQLEQKFLVLPSIKRESAKVAILAQSALHAITELENYDEETTEVVAIAQWAKSRAKLIGRMFRLQIKDDQTNIAIVNKLLRKIGYRSASVARLGSRDDRRQIWKAEAMPYQGMVWAALETRWAKELAAETIEIEQPQPRVIDLHIRKEALIQINDTALKRPVDRGSGPVKLTESDQLALANLMIRYDSYDNLTAQLEQSALSQISAAALARFAAITISPLGVGRCIGLSANRESQ